MHCRCSLPPCPGTTGALCICAPLRLAAPRRIPRSPPPPYPALPLVPFRIHPFRPHWRFTSLCVSPRLTSPHLASPASPLPLSRSLPHPSLPRRSRSRCNERCTLLSSCSRRRCFHSAAQSVSAGLPARFARRFASARRASGLISNEPKPTWREIEESNLSQLFITP